ncbi:hypothetical protein [Nostoc sp. 106C]|uniref:hypothetical protein n=1 Tax=Nostoc sp. 106C TaxID=1932667 RepID=UPI00117CAEED|nr:hypothetical protein [Nostoc sp. 106C]
MAVLKSQDYQATVKTCNEAINAQITIKVMTNNIVAKAKVCITTVSSKILILSLALEFVKIN